MMDTSDVGTPGQESFSSPSLPFYLDPACDIPNMDIPPNWNWTKKLPSWSITTLALKGFPGFDIDERRLTYRLPYEINIFVYPGARTSRDIAIEFDDLAQGHFDYGDFTPNMLPFGDYYSSTFTFQKKADFDLFLEKYGGWVMR